MTTQKDNMARALLRIRGELEVIIDHAPPEADEAARKEAKDAVYAMQLAVRRLWKTRRKKP